MNDKLLMRLLAAENNFKDTLYQPIVDEAMECFNQDKTDEAVKVLCKLPTEEELLRSLIEKLKGKSVYKTLKRMDEGKIRCNAEALKGLFSLGTHIVIECEKGRGEYRTLLSVIYDKIGELVYAIT